MTRKLSCREIFESLSDYIDEELDPDLCDEIEDHMKGCNPCVAFLNTLQKTVVLYKYSRRDDPVPEKVHIDLHRFLRQSCVSARNEG